MDPNDQSTGATVQARAESKPSMGYDGANRWISMLDPYSSALPIVGYDSRIGDYLLVGSVAWLTYRRILPESGLSFNQGYWLAISGLAGVIGHGLFREAALTYASVLF